MLKVAAIEISDESMSSTFVSVVSILKTSAFYLVIMHKVYGSFDDFKKSSSFPTMNALDTSNTNFAKAKISQTRNKFMENSPPKIGSATFISGR